MNLGNVLSFLLGICPNLRSLGIVDCVLVSPHPEDDFPEQIRRISFNNVIFTKFDHYKSEIVTYAVHLDRSKMVIGPNAQFDAEFQRLFDDVHPELAPLEESTLRVALPLIPAGINYEIADEILRE